VDIRIENDLRSWSREVLEVPSEHLKGMPPCPYAKEAWKKDKVLVLETDDIFDSTVVYTQFFEDFEKELVVVASFNMPDIDEFNAFVDELNRKETTLHCMGFHPGYNAEDAELDFLSDNDWVSSVDEDYCMIFIQDLQTVVRASDKLEKLGYYKAYPESEYQELVVERKRRLQWL